MRGVAVAAVVAVVLIAVGVAAVPLHVHRQDATLEVGVGTETAEVVNTVPDPDQTLWNTVASNQRKIASVYNSPTPAWGVLRELGLPTTTFDAEEAAWAKVVAFLPDANAKIKALATARQTAANSAAGKAAAAANKEPSYAAKLPFVAQSLFVTSSEATSYRATISGLNTLTAAERTAMPLAVPETPPAPLENSLKNMGRLQNLVPAVALNRARHDWNGKSWVANPQVLALQLQAESLVLAWTTAHAASGMLAHAEALPSAAKALKFEYIAAHGGPINCPKLFPKNYPAGCGNIYYTTEFDQKVTALKAKLKA